MKKMNLVSYVTYYYSVRLLVLHEATFIHRNPIHPPIRSRKATMKSKAEGKKTHYIILEV